MAENADVVVLTALDIEAEAFRPLMEKTKDVETPHRRYFRGYIAGRSVVVWSMRSMGNVGSAIAAQQSIAVWNPDYIILAGITGGFRSKDVQLGDVVVPEQVVSYEAGRETEKGTQRRYQVFRTSQSILRAAAAAADSNWMSSIRVDPPEKMARPTTVRFRDIASGEKVIASKSWAPEFREAWPKLTGVEMEGFGLLLSMYKSEDAPEAAVVKSICDWADPRKDDRWQPYAAAAAAAFVSAVIARLTDRRQATGAHRPQPQRINSSLSTTAPSDAKKGWGAKKVQMCRGLDHTEQRELADCLEIPTWEKAKFDDKAYCSSVWDYLQRTGKLSELPDVLRNCLGRDQLAELVAEYC